MGDALNYQRHFLYSQISQWRMLPHRHRGKQSIPTSESGKL